MLLLLQEEWVLFVRLGDELMELDKVLHTIEALMVLLKLLNLLVFVPEVHLDELRLDLSRVVAMSKMTIESEAP